MYIVSGCNSSAVNRWQIWLTLRVVIADCEVRRNAATSAAQALRRAVLGDAADRSGVFPDHLGHVAPGFKVAFVEAIRVLVNSSFTVVASISVGPHLCVVEELSDDGGYIVALDTCSDVLAVFDTINFPV